MYNNAHIPSKGVEKTQTAPLTLLPFYINPLLYHLIFAIFGTPTLEILLIFVAKFCRLDLHTFSADFFRLRTRFCRLSVLLELKFHGRLSEYFFHLKYCIVFHKKSAGLVAVVTNICRPMPFNSPPSPLSFHCLSALSLSLFYY